MRAWVRYAGYPAWFFVVFVISLYFTAPVSLLKGKIISAGEKALGKGDVRRLTRYGTDPEIKIGMLSLYRLSGLSFEHLSIRLPSKNPDPGPTVEFDELNVRVSLLSLMFGDTTVSFSGRLYQGTVDGSASVGDKQRLTGLNVDVEGVMLDRAPVVLERAGLPVTGTVNLEVALALGDDPAKEGEGEIAIDTKRLSVGPGVIKVPMMSGGLSIPLVDMGVLSGKIVFKNGKGTSEGLTLVGRDVHADFQTEIALQKALGRSRLETSGKFAIEKKFLDDNGKFKTILEFPGPLKKAKDKEGNFHFSIRGTLGDPRFQLSRTGGVDKRSKASLRRARRARRAERAKAAKTKADGAGQDSTDPDGAAP